MEGSEKWHAAKKTVKEVAYRKALDKLEGLLVARMFEMTRLNVAGTGAFLSSHLNLISDISFAQGTRCGSILLMLSSFGLNPFNLQLSPTMKQ